MEQKYNQIKIYTDYDGIYEIDGLLRKLMDFFTIPLLNNLPSSIFVKSSKKAESVSKHATTHKALEIVYNFNYKFDFRKGILEEIFTYLWNLTHNAKALRNRLKLVKKQLMKSISEVEKDEITIASLACGSTRAVIETIANFKSNKNFKIYAVDKNEKALEASKSLAKSLKIEHLFTWYQASINDFLDSLNEIQFDIIEMVGFLDYRNDEEAIELFNKIYDRLNQEGFFITGNIKPNPEVKFLVNVVKWPYLIFRNENDLITLFSKSKFVNSTMEIVTEPQHIHIVSRIKKI